MVKPLSSRVSTFARRVEPEVAQEESPSAAMSNTARPILEVIVLRVQSRMVYPTSGVSPGMASGASSGASSESSESSERDAGA